MADTLNTALSNLFQIMDMKSSACASHKIIRSFEFNLCKREAKHCPWGGVKVNLL